MALLHFLYKDESLIASLYAQIFRGRLVQIDHGQKDTRSDGTEVGGSLKIVSGSARQGNSFEESRHELIDPHDAATLDVLNHLQKFAVDEKSSKKGDIVLLSGGIFLTPYAHRKCILDFGFASQSHLFDTILATNVKDKRSRAKIIELAKMSCVGDENDVRFFFRSLTGIWYWGSLQQTEIMPTLFTLQVAYGIDLIPVSLVAINLGGTKNAPDAQPERLAGFAQMIHHMTGLTNDILAGEGASISSAIAPLCISQTINADDVGEDTPEV
ncbi:MAG: hypothetical protein LBM00_03795 [Deltaproteobacteria bacterium]|jgi:hypothetical protein|nr:hypothetical protein [Deltaproteobacteria bacterium]